MVEVKVHASQVEMIGLDDLKPYERNARTHPQSQIDMLARIIADSGFTSPVLIDDENGIVAGHGRALAARQLGMAEVPCVRLSGLTPDQVRAIRISDNQVGLLSGFDTEILRLELDDLKTSGFDLSFTGFSAPELAGFGVEGYHIAETVVVPKVKLADRFGIVPFSVLNAREGWWQGRKRAWLSLGIRSEVGRGENLLKMSETVLEPDPEKRAAKKITAGQGWGEGGPARRDGGGLAEGSRQTASLKNGLTHGTTIHPYDGTEGGDASAAGTSIFDPVLCELAYRWFSPPTGKVLDPFAGGSVRGIVAARLKRSYTGIDLRPEQIEANKAQAKAILRSGDPKPTWIEGDAKDTAKLVKAEAFDFLFSCPPYMWLEVYSEDPRDLSTMDAQGFEEAYFGIIAAAVAKLAPDRFACFVVGDVRDKRGAYMDFPGMTIDAFEAAGLRLYNDAILVTAAGSLPMRAARAFEKSRKLGTTHQRVLVFVKGDPVKATEAVGKVEFGEVEGAELETLAPAPRKARGEAPGTDETKYGERLTSLGGEVL